MDSPATRSSPAEAGAQAARIDMKLEALTIPVADVDRAKQFYAGLGWRVDADLTAGGGRVVQVTPPGSGCSVHFGTKVTSSRPGTSQSPYLVVSDVEAARDDLRARGVEVSEVFHFAGFDRLDPGARLDGPAPGRGSYGSFVSFRDPDGNAWLVQEITTRLPGRVDAPTVDFGSATDLAGALRRAEAAHGEHERRTGQRDARWPEWYAAYLMAERSGQPLPS